MNKIVNAIKWTIVMLMYCALAVGMVIAVAAS
jgi:hypothetical protein